MKRMMCIAIFLMAMLSVYASASSCAAEMNMDSTIKITVGNEVFTARLEESPAATAFSAMLPLTLLMSELNGNEKFYRLPNSLPSNASNPGTIQNGDIMLYGADTLVVFYKSFSTSYSYTRIGRIENPGALEKALGPGQITVIFEKM